MHSTYVLHTYYHNGTFSMFTVRNVVVIACFTDIT